MARRHPIRWFAAAPFWAGAAPGSPGGLLKPRLLRLARDDFMEHLQARLAVAAPGLADLEATRTSFAEPLPLESATTRSAAAAAAPLKLFQPVHGHFNLVVATLACQDTGLPDVAIDRNRGDAIGFVLRRAEASGGESAWVAGGADGARWVELASGEAEALVDGEEVAPLFPLACGDPAAGRPRTLWAGLVPTASKETSLEQASPADAAAPTAADPPTLGTTTAAADRAERLDRLVFEPILALRAEKAAATAGSTLAGADAVAARREATTWILLDLAAFLEAELPECWRALRLERAVPAAARELHALLTRAKVGVELAGTPVSVAEALRTVAEQAPNIHLGTWTHPWSFAPAATSTHDLGMRRDDVIAALEAALAGGAPADGRGVAEAAREAAAGDVVAAAGAPRAPAPIERLRGGRRQALDVSARLAGKLARGSASGEVAAVATRVPKLDASGRTAYRIRCIYRRPERKACPTIWVSRPTDDFRLAGYFDPDAPARPVRISLPVDTSIAAMRRSPRSVGVLLSQELRRQITRAGGLKDLLQPSVKDAAAIDVGHLCTFSIPIITICALILLLVMVQLLDLVFRWVPWFMVCFPLRLKAKS